MAEYIGGFTVRHDFTLFYCLYPISHRPALRWIPAELDLLAPLGSLFSATAKQATTAVPLLVKGILSGSEPDEPYGLPLPGFRRTLARPVSEQHPTVVLRRR